MLVASLSVCMCGGWGVYKGWIPLPTHSSSQFRFSHLYLIFAVTLQPALAILQFVGQSRVTFQSLIRDSTIHSVRWSVDRSHFAFSAIMGGFWVTARAQLLGRSISSLLLPIRTRL